MEQYNTKNYKKAITILKKEKKRLKETNLTSDAYDIAIEALEKQMPKKPKLKKVKVEVECGFAGGEVEAYEDEMSAYLCPSCNELVGDSYNRKTHCICDCICGQRLDWSDDND